METDATYFRRRALEEQLAALKAESPKARRAHRELAARYDALARGGVDQDSNEDRAGIWI
jgi:hypothetical protein